MYNTYNFWGKLTYWNYPSTLFVLFDMSSVSSWTFAKSSICEVGRKLWLLPLKLLLLDVFVFDLCALYLNTRDMKKRQETDSVYIFIHIQINKHKHKLTHAHIHTVHLLWFLWARCYNKDDIPLPSCECTKDVTIRHPSRVCFQTSMHTHSIGYECVHP